MDGLSPIWELSISMARFSGLVPWIFMGSISKPMFLLIKTMLKSREHSIKKISGSPLILYRHLFKLNYLMKRKLRI